MVSWGMAKKKSTKKKQDPKRALTLAEVKKRQAKDAKARARRHALGFPSRTDEGYSAFKEALDAKYLEEREKRFGADSPESRSYDKRKAVRTRAAVKKAKVAAAKRYFGVKKAAKKKATKKK